MIFSLEIELNKFEFSKIPTLWLTKYFGKSQKIPTLWILTLLHTTVFEFWIQIFDFQFKARAGETINQNKKVGLGGDPIKQNKKVGFDRCGTFSDKITA